MQSTAGVFVHCDILVFGAERRGFRRNQYVGFAKRYLVFGYSDGQEHKGGTACGACACIGASTAENSAFCGICLDGDIGIPCFILLCRTMGQTVYTGSFVGVFVRGCG